MEKKGFYFIMICLFIGLFLSPAAGNNASDELNHYYYSGTGNNIFNIMYTEIDWQDCTSATIIFTRKYNIGPGDDAYMVFFNDTSMLNSIEALHYTGTQEEKIQYEMVNNFIGYKYMGYYYRTDDIEYGDGFCVDNIQLYSSDLEKILFYDNGENTADKWILDGFTLESENVSYNRTLMEITPHSDMTIEKGANWTITWIISITDPDMANKYWVYKNDTMNSTLYVSPTDYQSFEIIQVTVDTTIQGTWNYTIFVNDTSSNIISDQVNITIIDNWRDEWIGEDTQGGSAVTTGELQNAIYHWLEDLPVRDYILSTMDLQDVISLWLSE